MPLPGDYIYYAWGERFSFGDCTGWADHVVYMPLGINAAKWIQDVDKNASFDFVSSVYDSGKESFIANLSAYRELLTGGNTVGFDLNASAWGGDDVIDAIHNAGLNVSFWGVNNTSFFAKNPLRVIGVPSSS